MLKIDLPRKPGLFMPGETISVHASWELPNDCDRVELRLVWNTIGKGDRDLSIFRKWVYEPASYQGEETEQILLPDAPYSFSGKLLSLVWALELIAFPGGESIREEIVIAPQGQELQLHSSQSVLEEP